jgi:choline dehydrogenase-like flavoprotein
MLDHDPSYRIEPLRQAVTDCLHCGWCNAGCPYGRKNDLLQNYLPAAERLGVAIEPLAAALTIEPAPDGYRVRYRKMPSPTMSIFDPRASLDEVTAPEVIIAAGTVGTATLLHRSRPFLPTLSWHVGQHLSGNGDLPLGAFLPARTDGYQGVAMDTVTYQWLESDGFIVITQHMLPLSTAVLGRGDGAGPPSMWGLERKHDFRDFGAHFVGLAVIGLDDSEGQIVTDEGQINGALLTLGVRYAPSEATTARWNRARTVLRAIVEGAGGRFLDLAHELPVRNQTAHPLGTARMAEEGAAEGVVSPDLDVHGYPGLRIVDGSVIPSALAVNPSLTIAAVAERAMLAGADPASAPTPAEILS